MKGKAMPFFLRLLLLCGVWYEGWSGSIPFGPKVKAIMEDGRD